MGFGVYTTPGAEFRAQLSLGITGGGDLFFYDDPAALYDEALYSADGLSLTWVDISSRLLGFRTNRGRDTFEELFTPGTFSMELDNVDGIFNPELGEFQLGGLSLRPGRWARIQGRAIGDPGSEGTPRFRFLDREIGTHIVAPGFDVDSFDAGFTMRGRIATESIPVAPGARLVNVWSGVSTNRKMQIFMRDNSSLRFQVQTPAGGVSLTTGPVDLTGEGLTFSAAYTPGGELTFSVQGEPLLTNPGPMDPLQVTTHPLTVASRADLIEAGTGWLGDIHELEVVPTVGAAIRLFPSDAGENGPLDGVSWTEPLGGHVWDALGEVVLADVGISDWFTLILGRIDAISERYGDAAADPTTTIRGSDLQTNWNRNDPPDLETPRISELSSDRIIFLLESVGLNTELLDPIDAFIDPGVFDMQASVLPNPLGVEMQRVAESEGGAFFLSREGSPRFRSRDWLEEGERESVVQFAAGNVGQSIQLVDTPGGATWDTSRVLNDVQITRKEGNPQRAQSTVSIARYGSRTFRRTDFENELDADVFFLCERKRDRFEFDTLRLRQVNLYASDAQGARDLLAVELGWRIRVTVRTLTESSWSYTFDAWVQRIEHVGQIDGGWETRLTIDNVDRSDPEDGGPYSSAYSSAYNRPTT